VQDAESRIHVCLASQVTTVVVEAYKRIQVTQGMMDHSDYPLMVDHQALYDLCRALYIEPPTYAK
jgi:hypothetical protein